MADIVLGRLPKASWQQAAPNIGMSKMESFT